jgi:hypothetical protein
MTSRAITWWVALALTLMVAGPLGCGSGCGDKKAPRSQPAPAAGAKTAAEPAADAALVARCGEAFDHMVSVMEREGTPADITSMFRERRDGSIDRCLRQSADPKGREMLDCMLRAETNADIMLCSGAPAGPMQPQPPKAP